MYDSKDDLFKDSLWIWSNNNAQTDEYSEFKDTFVYNDGKVYINISADSNYAVYLNGKMAAWGQYADYPYDKVYDSVDITDFCIKGINHLGIVVWYYGIDTTQVYYPGKASLIYEVISADNNMVVDLNNVSTDLTDNCLKDNLLANSTNECIELNCNRKILCKSSENTLSRVSKTYINHKNKIITGQLGLSFKYDATREDEWLTKDVESFTDSFVVKQNTKLRLRPCNRLKLGKETVGSLYQSIADTDLIFDLNKEEVGFLYLEFESSVEQDILVAYGEHLNTGKVSRIIESRDFSVEFKAKKGFNSYMNPFRRLGCRYLEVQSKYPVSIKKIAIVPTYYPVNEKEKPRLNKLQNNIYDACVNTLKLCMHEHYEDCPWREQALYTMDSRNQMLCGYYAFGEYDFPRANLELISKDNRPDGLLSICYPMKHDFVIPSFSLHYITACREYLQYSGDSEFIKSIYPKMESVINAFIDRVRDGLVYPFKGDRYWNFYEWREGLGGDYGIDLEQPDLILNALFSIALHNMALIADELNITNLYEKYHIELNKKIVETFWNETLEAFVNRPNSSQYSELGNYLAILCGAVDADGMDKLCEKIINDTNATPISLSMNCFKYDAWLMTDNSKYKSLILKDIEKIYTPMIETSSDTVWETELGWSDFNGAGSLCHGWSALPVYYYHILT